MKFDIELTKPTLLRTESKESMRPIRDYVRAIEYQINYWLFEKPYGVNFSTRDLSQIQNSQQHGYAMTSDKAIRNIAQIVDFSNRLFLDIGSGKGRVVSQAVKLGARRAEGIEFSEKLHNIAKKNFEILKLSDDCKSNYVDATKFDRYGDFDIFSYLILLKMNSTKKLLMH